MSVQSRRGVLRPILTVPGLLGPLEGAVGPPSEPLRAAAAGGGGWLGRGSALVLHQEMVLW